MLQRVNAEIGELRGLGMAENTKHATVIVKMIVAELDYLAQDVASMALPRDSAQI